MNPFLYRHVADGALRRGMLVAVPKFHLASATAIAHLAEFDARKLYVPEGYPSMSAFCVGELGLTEQVANKLIRVGRTALHFPEIFLALADGRLNATGVIILAPWLTRENAAALLAAAARRSNEEIRELLADRAPKLDVPLSLEPVPVRTQVSAQTPEALAEEPAADPAGPFGHGGNSSMVSAQTPPTPMPPQLTPLGLGRFETRFTMGGELHEVMRRYEQLLGRPVTSEEMNEAACRGFRALIADFEKRRFAATDRPRRQRKPVRGRRVAAAVMREVAQRDERRCTYVSPDGRRCEARARLEYDHIDPVARGIDSRPRNVRLLCRAHNQYMAEQIFGAGFMHEQRERARRAAEVRRARAAAARRGEAERTVRRARAGTARPPSEPASPAATPAESDVVPWLVRLGFKAQEARRAAAHCEAMPHAPLEDRVRAALSFLAPPARVSGARSGPAPARSAAVT